MRILADENVDTEAIRALVDSGHDVVRVVDDPELGESALDPAVLGRATKQDRVLLAEDTSDFGDPPLEEHAGIILVTDGTVSGSEARRGIRRIERQYPDLSGAVAHLSDWIWRIDQCLVCSCRVLVTPARDPAAPSPRAPSLHPSRAPRRR